MLFLAANCSGAVCVPPACLPCLGGLLQFEEDFIYLGGLLKPPTWRWKNHKSLLDNSDETVLCGADKLFSFQNDSLKPNPGFSK